MQNQDQLEQIAQNIMEIFEIFAPPVPIETMLQRPAANLWEKVDPSQLSGSFLSVRDRYSPRMSLARLLARHIAVSEWGRNNGLYNLIQNADALNAFARMLIMPRDMVMGMTQSNRNPTTMSTYFEVPKEDAEMRLNDLV
jgi:hypothetical protein